MSGLNHLDLSTHFGANMLIHCLLLNRKATGTGGFRKAQNIAVNIYRLIVNLKFRNSFNEKGTQKLAGIPRNRNDLDGLQKIDITRLCVSEAPKYNMIIISVTT